MTEGRKGKPKIEVNRAKTVYDITNRKFKVMDFEGRWFDLMGKPELKGSMICWGHSGNGKTRGMLQFAKYLTNFGKVAYNTIEEGVSLSIQKALIDVGMQEVRKGSFFLLDKEPMDELAERLRKPRSPDIIFIDSFQYSELNKSGYIKLMREFGEKKMFVWVSHAEGLNPEGRTAKSVRYDAFVKMRVEGFRIFAQGRYGGGKPYDIWPEKARQYYNEDLIANNNE